MLVLSWGCFAPYLRTCLSRVAAVQQAPLIRGHKSSRPFGKSGYYIVSATYDKLMKFL